MRDYQYLTEAKKRRSEEANSRWKAHERRIDQVPLLGEFAIFSVRKLRALYASHSGNRGTYEITHNNPKSVGG
jgi:hypothetical protein